MNNNLTMCNLTMCIRNINAEKKLLIQAFVNRKSNQTECITPYLELICQISDITGSYDHPARGRGAAAGKPMFNPVTEFANELTRVDLCLTPDEQAIVNRIMLLFTQLRDL